MNVNFGLFPPITDKMRKADRKLAYTSRAKIALESWMG
jgi:methylenetetrahydrofolate--tRNA-(uracil-5-)-methyltransferase